MGEPALVNLGLKDRSVACSNLMREEKERNQGSRRRFIDSTYSQMFSRLPHSAAFLTVQARTRPPITESKHRLHCFACVSDLPRGQGLIHSTATVVGVIHGKKSRLSGRKSESFRSDKPEVTSDAQANRSTKNSESRRNKVPETRSSVMTECHAKSLF